MAVATHHDHERSDVSVRPLVRFLAVFAISMAILMMVLVGFWRLLRANDGPSTSRWAAPRELPPSPRLQAAPERDLQEMLRRDLGRLNGYGPAGENGFHIPIERAIDLTAQRGLPARATQQQPDRIPSPGTSKEASHEPAVR